MDTTGLAGNAMVSLPGTIVANFTESADPYVTVTFSKQGKPLYSTRIIERDLDPVFEETAIVLVDANAIKVRERLCLQLWDSDRGSAVRVEV